MNPSKPLIHEWLCGICDADGIGDGEAVDKAADKHTRLTGHHTLTRVLPPAREPERERA